jgi:hypothetical protein
MSRPRPLTVREILCWADAHHERHGTWPKGDSGPIPEAPGVTWRRVNTALGSGTCGLPPGSSLLRLLEHDRGVRHRLNPARFTITRILAWADAHRARAGEWPDSRAGAIPEAPGETWKIVDRALRTGERGLSGKCGLRGGSTLVRLLAAARGRRNQFAPPSLTVRQIMAWADAFRARPGRWPESRSGGIPEAPGESWGSVQRALKYGARGLPGGLSLARLRRERSAWEVVRRLKRAKQFRSRQGG